MGPHNTVWVFGPEHLSGPQMISQSMSQNQPLGILEFLATRVDTICKCIRLSYHIYNHPEGVLSDIFWWLFVKKLFLKTNNHRESIFTSSTTICVDEFISRCCIIWGEWINDGVPIYVTIDCKPEGWLWDPRCCWCQISNNDADETHEDWVVEEKSKIVCDNMNMD